MHEPSASTAHQRARPAPRSRLGRGLRRLRWPVLIGWVLAIIALHPLAASLYQVTNGTAAANLSASAPSTRVLTLQQRADHDDGTIQNDAVAVVIARGGGLTTEDRAVVARTRAALEHLSHQLDGLGTPSDPRFAPDGQAAALTSTVTAPTLHQTSTDTTDVRAVRRAVGPLTRADEGLHVAVTGAAATNADSGSTSQNSLLLTALVIVGLILLIVYRSILLWIFPLLGALGGIVIAQATAHGLGSGGLIISPLSTSILIVLAFGAASDYALLLIHRYRDELRQQAAVEDAMATALRRTLPTLVASAATVIGAMFCLLAADSATLHGLGPVGAVAIASALLAQTTFLPAMLLIVGRVAFWPSRPTLGATGNEESRVWTGIGHWVARRPGPVSLAALLLLGAACAGLVTLHTDNDPLDNLKGRPDSVVGAQMFSKHFGQGATAPVVLLTPPHRADAAAATARTTPDVDTVVTGPPVVGYASYTVTLSVGPYTTRGSRAVAELRQRLDRAAPGSLVGGVPAIQYDISRAAHRDDLVLIPLVLVIIFLIVSLLLRAVAAPLVLVGTTAISFGASFGMASLLWHYGLHYDGIEAQLPLYIFVFLVALGVDYNIFLSARVREEALGIGTRRGTIRGLAVTGGVITAAGLVLAGTFAALAQGSLVDLTMVGTAIAIGVLLDTLLVRTILVPAAFLSIGKRVWWPSTLASDRDHPRGTPATNRAASQT